MKVMALDFGSARTGVAVSDPTGLIARPLCVVQRAASEDGLAELERLVEDEEVETVVVGGGGAALLWPATLTIPKMTRAAIRTPASAAMRRRRMRCCDTRRGGGPGFGGITPGRRSTTRDSSRGDGPLRVHPRRRQPATAVQGRS